MGLNCKYIDTYIGYNSKIYFTCKNYDNIHNSKSIIGTKITRYSILYIYTYWTKHNTGTIITVNCNDK